MEGRGCDEIGSVVLLIFISCAGHAALTIQIARMRSNVLGLEECLLFSFTGIVNTQDGHWLKRSKLDGG